MLFILQCLGLRTNSISPHPQSACANATSPQGEVIPSPPAHPREGEEAAQISKMDTHLRGYERGG